MDHIDKTRALTNNRMYCDYYKLYNIILNHIKENRADLISVNSLEQKTYPVYKDLDPFQEYKIEDVRELHTNILHLINQLFSQSLDKSDEIEHYNDTHHIGFSISNFLNTLQYENRLLREQISLYINYVSFFHISQKRQLTRLYVRMQEFHKEIEENININQTFSIDDISEEKRLNRFYIIGEEVVLESILEDSELLLGSSEDLLARLNAITGLASGSETETGSDGGAGSVEDISGAIFAVDPSSGADPSMNSIVDTSVNIIS